MKKYIMGEKENEREFSRYKNFPNIFLSPIFSVLIENIKPFPRTIFSLRLSVEQHSAKSNCSISDKGHSSAIFNLATLCFQLKFQI